MRRIKEIYTALAVVLIASAVLFFNGCQNDQAEYKFNTNWEYLDFSSDFTGEGDLTDRDLEMLIAAGDRLTCYTTIDNLTYVKNLSSHEINVSKRVFLYILEMVENGNELVMRSSDDINIAPMTKNGSESSQKNDCVARCIGYLGGSYDDAWRYTLRNYGPQGVPSNSMTSMLKVFFPSIRSTNELTNKNYYHAIVILNGSHAVVCVGYSGGYIYYTDPQTGMYGMAHQSEIGPFYVR